MNTDTDTACCMSYALAHPRLDPAHILPLTFQALNPTASAPPSQIWRLLTNFFFFGFFSLEFLFHMYFLVRYCRLLEEGSFRGRTADFVFMFLFGAGAMLSVAPFVSIHFLGHSLTFMMVYLWGRRNEYVRMSFLGLFPFTAPYLPWVLLSFSMLLGSSATVDLLGIAVGHIYYFMEDVYPQIAEIRGWTVRRPLRAPRFFATLCGDFIPVPLDPMELQDPPPVEAAN